MIQTKKSLGQHFLRHKETIESIVQSCPISLDSIEGIIEIGPGDGALTDELEKLGLPLILIEKDKRLIELHRNKERKVIDCDALKVDLSTELKKYQFPQKNLWLVSNLPYNVGTPIFTRMLFEPSLVAMSLMFQKEVAQKVLFEAKKEAMNSLGVLSSVLYDFQKLITVPPSCFSPPPKVESMVIIGKKHNNPPFELKSLPLFEPFLRKLFGQRRKQIQSNLSPFAPKEDIFQLCSELELSPALRPGNLTLTEVTSLFNGLVKKGKIV